MAARTHSPVVLMGHSMGNRVIQYFLNWVVHTDPTRGRKWISDNGTHARVCVSTPFVTPVSTLVALIGRTNARGRAVHTFMAVGAPWLGASKAVRGLATGEKFGLDAFLTDLEAITFGHRICTRLFLVLLSVVATLSLSLMYVDVNIIVVVLVIAASTACLLPVGCEKMHHHLPASLESFAHFVRRPLGRALSVVPDAARVRAERRLGREFEARPLPRSVGQRGRRPRTPLCPMQTPQLSTLEA